jgi:DNA repair exonuclease SbcCD ATPase subunit
MTDSVSKWKRSVESLQRQQEHAGIQMKSEAAQVKLSKSSIRDVTRAQQIVQEIAKGIQQRAHSQIAQVVSKCLKAVFGTDAYEFQITFERKRGRTEATLQFIRDGNTLDPLDSSGGGVVDVCSFALRLACLVLARPKLRQVLVLDEPMKHVSSEYRERVAELLESMASELGVQIVIVTHSKELAIGKVIQL